ncbi:AMP-dependent synthetase/ligase [Macrophomina phaseolina MS6]|uniref:AMP-dependent synthetase/ligase n=1 Tax=Macrophomina phaseolina (strain MS6) TaxID=1126212 RepID=K2RGL8_MACPH|nr:AMP-dependent synthetase/ligase [Macrophomina phaseolina MS6]
MGKATHPADTGKPIGGRCWIVSKGNPHQLVPAGAVGELLVEGPHVARGYLHEPEKTRAAFVEGLRWMAGRRLYRTGDMVRYQPDGSIYFVGRADSQVKVRGQRVELGEVEHQMYASGQVGDAVVLFPASGPLSNALIAVVSFPGLSRASPADQGGVQVLHPDDRPEAQRRAALLKDHLTEHLPRYMVPSTLLPLASFPFSASGKLDRKMVHDWLLSVDKQTLESAQSGDLDSPGPETETEMAVARAWSWVLNVPLETIRRTDSFLRLGGKQARLWGRATC